MSTTARPPLKRKIIPLLFLLLAAFVILQAVHRPVIDNPPVNAGIKAPEQVKAILKKACYDCHSNETNLRWYDKVNPVYWKVAQDVKDGRAGLNFSNFDSLAAPDQKAKLWEAINMIQLDAMPLKSYTLVHNSAKVSAGDLAILKTYLTGMVSHQPADTSKSNAHDKQYSHWIKEGFSPQGQPVALNGVQFIPDYKNWAVVTTSDRFDNGTMRVITGNAIAIRAIQKNQINPWPNGTTFAKITWEKLVDEKGNVRTGAFKQVEFMIKDDRKYRSTAGWGFARFKTPKMLPYGKTRLFATECVNCHRPMASNDFVFTLPVKH